MYNPAIHNCIIVLGPTASGKTKRAVELAHQYHGEIISIDSRQVYRQLDIGTGKDLHEYRVHNTPIPHHLINIVDPNQRYNVFHFSNAFYEAFSQIIKRNKLPILCGGTGLYFDVLLKQNKLIAVPVNGPLRTTLEQLSHTELINRLNEFEHKQHYAFDTSTIKRTIRALEILNYLEQNPAPEIAFHNLKPYTIGMQVSVEQRRQGISNRLQNRLQNGLIEEAQNLLQKGLSHEQLQYFGLEYKYLSLYLSGKLDLNSMTLQLEAAIHQYAKRQMTWFRKMEREGFEINWV